MKTVLAVLAGLLLTGCAGLGPGLKSVADSINKSVARAPDATVNVNINQR